MTETQAPYPYRPLEPLTRQQCQVMSVRFAPDWTLVEVARMVYGAGGKLVADRHGNMVVVRRDPAP